MAKGSMSEAKKNSMAVILFVVVGGIYYKNFIAKPSGSQRSPNASAGQRAAPGASPSPGGAPPPAGPGAQARPGGPAGAPAAAPPVDPNAQITIRPTDIPQLSDEVKAKLKNRGGGGNGSYPDLKVQSGSNPFLSFDVDQEKIESAGPGSSRPGRAQRKTPKFTKAMKFWGAFSADEETRAIVEVEGASIPWTGRVGENVDDTPFVLSEVSPDGRFVKLFDPNDPDSPGVTLWFEGAKESGAKPATGSSSGLFKQPDAGGRD
jgi:hypothetical protein